MCLMRNPPCQLGGASHKGRCRGAASGQQAFDQLTGIVMEEVMHLLPAPKQGVGKCVLGVGGMCVCVYKYVC